MLGIMAGVNQKDSYAESYIVDSGSGRCLAGFAGCLVLALYSLLSSSGPDACHHGRHGPEGQLRGEMQLSVGFLCRGGLGYCFSRARVRGISLGSDWWW